MWEWNGLPTQTAQSTHALPLFITYLGRIERESASICWLPRKIAHHLIVAPIPPSRKLLQIYKAQTKWFIYWHPNRRRSTSIAHMISWEGNIKSCVDTPIEFFRAIEPDRLWGPFSWRNLIVEVLLGIGVSRISCTWTQQFSDAAAPHFHQTSLAAHQMWATFRLLDCIVTFLCNCSRRESRGRPVTNAESRFSWVSVMRGSGWKFIR